MRLDEFKRILDDHGIRYQTSGVSIALQECPACGFRDYKVLLRVVGVNPNEPFFGRCQHGRCREGYSSVKYLLKMGVPRPEVLDAHGLDPVASLESLIPTNREFDEALNDTPEQEVKKDTDISKFFQISSWPEHPASKYAISRGATPEHYNTILIDDDTNAVVFVCYNKDGVCGYQKRFVRPSNPRFKTRSSDGFKKSEELLLFQKANADILVCEGPFTALSAWHYGYYGVCTFGSGISAIQIDKIVKLADKLGRNIGIAFEEDKAGRDSYDRLRRSLHWLERDLFIVKPEIGGDLNDSWQAGKGTFIAEVDDWGGPAIPDMESFEV